MRETFPNIQFTATAHSPIMLASCKDESVISIDSNMNIEYKKSLYGLPINDVLVTYQNSDNIVSNIKVKLAAFYKSVEMQEYNEASHILGDLSNELGEGNLEVVGAKMTLDLETLPLED